ncbi:MAG TPA: YibE/F family protein [bacterium]|nr:YibE/F family protein [bacterium]
MRNIARIIRKTLFLIPLICLCALPLAVSATDLGQSESDSINFQEEGKRTAESSSNRDSVRQDQRIEALVMEVLDQKIIEDELGKKVELQNIKLKGLSDKYKDKEIVFRGIDNKISTKQAYQKGDKLIVRISGDASNEVVTIEDASRINPILWLLLIFIVTVLLFTKGHGLRSLVSLFLTLIIIVKWVVPAISSGSNPLLITLIAAFAILLVTILLVYGWNKKSAIAITGTFTGVLITLFLSVIFSNLAMLTGFAAEESIYLLEIFQDQINLRGLLLSGFVLGSLGILDDIAVTQVSTVEEIKKANPQISQINLYKSAMKVGVDHISSMINTLFLAYAGASFFLLFLFNIKQPPFENFTAVINNEIISTEIVRTLVGSIGLILCVPITTYVASKIFSKSITK